MGRLLTLLMTTVAAVAANPVDRHVANTFVPGHSSGAGTATSTGVAINYSITLTNNSGTTMNSASLVFWGCRLTASGMTATGNDVPVTANVEYPIGGTTTNMLQSGGTGITVANNIETATDNVALATPIPNGAQFKVNMTGTPANGLTYLTQYTASGATTCGFGLVAVRTRALPSAFRKECLFAVGDSIATNNGGAVSTAASYLGCPSIHGSISGTTAQSYGASSAAQFTRQVAMAALAGCTRFVSNFGTNDFGTGRSLVQLQGDLTAMKTRANASGILFSQTTMTPRASLVTVTANASVTSSGTSMTVPVPDATQFVVGRPYNVAGATPSEYNGVWFCTGRNTGANTVTLLFPGSGTTPATGTITLKPGIQTTADGWTSAELQTPHSTPYNAGSGSDRGQFNAWVRGGAFDGFIDWADACEPFRDAGRWAVGGEKTELSDSQLITVSSGISTTRFNSDYSRPNASIGSGTVQFITGANAGQRRLGSSNTNGDITVGSALTATPSAGDTAWAAPGSMRAVDDSLHPRVATGTVGTNTYRGGQALIVNPTNTWLSGLLA